MSSSRPKASAICLLALEILLCIAIYLLCLYIRRRRSRDRCWFRTRTTVRASVVPLTPSDSAPRGLDPSLVASFPVIPYSALVSNIAGGPQMTRLELDCAVCLISFQGDDTLRFIPTCRHVFHPECVDPWFSLHATCPYCRANLAIPGPREDELNGSGEGLTRSGQSPSGDVVILVTVTNEVSGGRTVAARDGVADSGRYTLRLSDDAWQNIAPESSSALDSRRLLPGESCPPMGSRGAGDRDDHDQKSIQLTG